MKKYEKIWKKWKKMKKYKKYEKIQKIWKIWKNIKKYKKYEKIYFYLNIRTPKSWVDYPWVPGTSTSIMACCCIVVCCCKWSWLTDPRLLSDKESISTANFGVGTGDETLQGGQRYSESEFMSFLRWTNVRSASGSHPECTNLRHRWHWLISFCEWR